MPKAFSTLMIGTLAVFNMLTSSQFLKIGPVLASNVFRARQKSHLEKGKSIPLRKDM